MESRVKAALTVAQIRARLAAERPARDPRERLRANVTGPVSATLEAVLERPGRAASVLLGVVARPTGLAMLLTERAAHLKDHAGQVSLLCLDRFVLFNHFVLASAYSCETYISLPSALAGLTAEFGMGSGVTPPLESPGLCTHVSNLP